MQQKMILIGAVVFAILAFWLSARYMANQKKKLYGDNRQIKVLAVAHDFQPGTVLQSTDIGGVTRFERGLGSDVFLANKENVALLENKRIIQRIGRGDVLRWHHVDIPQFNRGGFADSIGVGMDAKEKDLYRAIAVPVSVESAVAGLIKPNDRVDVIGTYVKPLPGAESRADTETVTRTMLQNVTVLATGQEYATATQADRANYRRGGSYSTCTLQVTPREAELLVFIQQAKGKLTFTLRRPNNLDFEKELPRVNFEHLDAELQQLNQERQDLIQKAGRF